MNHCSEVQEECKATKCIASLRSNADATKLYLMQCFSNIFMSSPPFHSRHVVFAPQTRWSKR